MATDIPVVSFQPFLSGSDSDRYAVANQVYDALTTVGFIYLKDHGIPQTRVDEMFALSAKFFDLPPEQKLKWQLNDVDTNQGYTAPGADNVQDTDRHDYKESYEHRRFNNALCPSEQDLPGFKSTVDEFYNQCLTLALQVLKCLAIVMKLGDDFFDRITKRADPQLRLLQYPPIPKTVLDQKGHARTNAHTDFGLCTLLFQDSVGGLQIDPEHNGDWKPAPPIPGTILINIGDLLQRYTNDRCKSTMHRVMSPQVAGDMLPKRFSMPFFVHPDPETLIDPITLDKDEVKRYEPVNAREWRNYNTAKNYNLKIEREPVVASVAG